MDSNEDQMLIIKIMFFMVESSFNKEFYIVSWDP